jgi:hypothetical protein
VLRLNKLIDLITESGVVNDSFGAKEIGVIYNLSMMTQVDEIHSTRHMDMRFIEFVEALARVADKAITRSTQEFVGRDPSQSGIQGAMDGTSNLSASKLGSSIKKGMAAALESSAKRNTPRDRSYQQSKMHSKNPSINKSIDHLSSPSVGGDDINKNLLTAEDADVPKFADLSAVAEDPMRKSQMSFNDRAISPLDNDNSLIQLKPVQAGPLSPKVGSHQYNTNQPTATE